MRRSTVLQLTAGSVLLLAAAAPAWAAPDFAGEWTVTGKHSKRGDYTGKITIDQRDKKVDVAADLRTASGYKLVWRGEGRATNNGIEVDFKLAEGIVENLIGAASARNCTGKYTLSADGNKLTGGWHSTGKKDKISATETLTRAKPLAGDGKYLTIVVGSKRSKEDCVPLNVEGDDLLRVELKADATAGADKRFKLKRTDRVGIWLSPNRAAGSEVTSDTLPNENTVLWVEGRKSSDAGVGETLSVELEGGNRDQVVVHVARSAFHLAGHGAGGAYQMNAWLGTAKLDQRTQPVMVVGKDEKSQKKAYWAVWVFETEKGARLAMEQPDAVISYDGHSNFGMGFAFQTGFKSIKEFFNIADPQVPVNWEYLRDHQEHPGLMIDDSEYADDASTQKFSDPIGTARRIQGQLGAYDTTRWPVSGGNGTRHVLERGSKKWQDHHYGSEDNWRIVVKAGSGDMPTKKWSRIYLHSCYSGPYYADSFGGKGTLFFTTDEAHAWSTALPAFIRSVVEGKSDADILKAINKEENLNDYVKAE
jgi:hypothetical protein